jgi:hypothetical protein
MKQVFLIALAVILMISALIAGSFLIKLHDSNTIGICMHLSDFNSRTESAMVDLGIKWVRIDWINCFWSTFILKEEIAVGVSK